MQVSQCKKQWWWRHATDIFRLISKADGIWTCFALNHMKCLCFNIRIASLLTPDPDTKHCCQVMKNVTLHLTHRMQKIKPTFTYVVTCLKCDGKRNCNICCLADKRIPVRPGETFKLVQRLCFAMANSAAHWRLLMLANENRWAASSFSCLEAHAKCYHQHQHRVKKKPENEAPNMKTIDFCRQINL